MPEHWHMCKICRTFAANLYDPMAKYNYEYENKYQEVDGKKRLRLFNLENYLLEVAGTVADDLGFGIATLHPRGLTWILTRLSIEMYQLPTHCQKVRF